MFIGSINQHVRSALRELAAPWKSSPAFIACSGNFTVERILASIGFETLHGNDVSLYSCALGSMLSGGKLDVAVVSDSHAWLGKYADTTERLAATLMICTEYFKYADRPDDFYKRIAAAYEARWEELHAGTMKRLAERTANLRLRTFTPMDCVDFLVQAPKDSVAVAFPPTYAGGYERMYKKMDEVFLWSGRPTFTEFDEERFAMFEAELLKFRHWVTMTDVVKHSLRPYLKGIFQTTPRSRPVYVYASAGKTSVAIPSQKIEQQPFQLERGQVEGPLNLAPISQGMMNMLRSEFLSPAITPADAHYSLAVLVGPQKKLVGGISFIYSPTLCNWCDLYMMTDLAIAPTVHGRLAKLVLAAALSKECYDYLEFEYQCRFKTVGTTAFTAKPASMKYRGLFEIYSRSKGPPPKINYHAQLGRWTLEEALQWWMKHHARHMTPDSLKPGGSPASTTG